ncbi:MAG: hypothetical protein C7B43_16475 [Sulfobacillus benefaciens]|uniref:t-SNARE coiled-coil homology domain-containing protein n=1 Tax=Sulfobacillus benefaciens TaxID=453960 RepID=A0A2T2WTD2_9FIRM|nr:MAG: hypothetical protein C7B43_16475 [Sulfobacillus benefaciens]
MADQHNTPEGPAGPEEKVSVSWLILQRLDDLKSQINEVKQDLAQFKKSTDDRFHSIDNRFNSIDRRLDSMNRQWMGSLGLILVMALGLLAKLLIPAA